MRRDIQVNTHIGDVVLHGNNPRGAHPFEWIKEGDVFVQGQITLPGNFDINTIYKDGVHVLIPYTPIYKQMQVKIVRDFGNGRTRTELNPVNGSEWFDIKTKLYGIENKDLYASQLLMISRTGFLIQLNRDIAYIWADSKVDFKNVNANIQNRNLLLKCLPSNSYRYPTSGVGLVQYLHSNLNQSGLAEKLQSEFKADKVTVKNAAFNAYTGDLDLDLDFSEADESV